MSNKVQRTKVQKSIFIIYNMYKVTKKIIQKSPPLNFCIFMQKY